MLRASVIVPARNARQTLPRTLAALARQELDGDYEVIVVDDGSIDGTFDVADGRDGVIALRQPPLGPAAARNRGVERSGGSVLAFCDADVFPTSGWLRAGVAALQRADMVQGKVLPDPLATLGPFDRSIWITSEVGLWETANLFVTRELFDRVGGFEQWIIPRRGKALAEDMWFGYRALRLGARPGFCAEALAHHAVFARDWRGYVRERARLQYFPAFARKMPELRRTFLYRHVFLNQHSALVDLAVAGGLVALRLRSPLPLAAALPYARAVRARSRRASQGGNSPIAVVAADVLADLVGFGAMTCGSARHRSVVI
jgi:glycosyltransferase involved in cell wall biosynthesis